MMKVRDFWYDLPQELIAQDPLKDRSSSRLLVVHRDREEFEHRHFHDICDYLQPGDCLVINDTKVIPARIFGEREGTGAKVEVLLLKRGDGDVWEVLVRPGRKCRVGDRLRFSEELSGEIIDIVEEGNRKIRFFYSGIFEEILDRVGQMPLPPYIHHVLQDKSRYQTVYAKYDGSAAAPTAGLHFTKELLSKVEAMGVRIAYVTLHVGLGTFRPVKTENILEHHMHSEYFVVPPETEKIVNETKQNGKRVICVGTTSCRTIESAARDKKLVSGSGNTDIFIYPGYTFQLMDGLITNFHLPESTLVMLVSAFAGKDKVMNAYAQAVKEKYRFYSFGDAMLLS